MVRFKDVIVDPWMQDQGEYDQYKMIPEDAVFACAYFVFMNPIEFVEAAYFRRTAEQDELWVASWNYEFDGGLPDYSIREQFDSFGCLVTTPRHGNEASACRILLTHLFRSRVGFSGPWHFEQSGFVSKAHYQGIKDSLEHELAQYAQAARANRSEIVHAAEELGLYPEPTGKGPYSWRANCPGTSHPIWIDTEKNIFGCPWCRKKGDSDELRAFVKERRAKRK